MGKDLTSYYFDNTREVLFEKIQIYYYRMESDARYSGGACLEKCMLRDDGYEIMIGSSTCSKCIYNKGFDDDREYIICSRLTKALGK